MMSVEAAPGVALAVKVRGLPVRPVLVAVRVLLFVPAVVPSFQEPTVAMPEALVVWELPVTEPPPEPAAKVTVVPATGLPNWSVTRTEGAVATLVSTVADWLLPLLIAIVVAASAVALAVKVRGLPVRPVLVAVRVLLFVPAVVPSFQEPTVAMPEALVVWELPVTEPPPEPAAKVTVVPATGLPNWSVTRTEGAVATLVSTVADWLLPLLIAIVVAASAVALAVKVRGLPVRPVLVAVRVLLFVPAVVPSFQEPTVAMPEALVVWELPVTEPPPEPAAKVTVVPATGLPNWSVTRTEGAVATLVSTVADWLLPLLIAIVVAASAVALAVKVRGLPVRPVLVAVRVLLFVPAVVPSFQEPTVAMPEALVVWELPVTEPPPEPAAKVTVVPATGLPNWSVTRTEGAVATLVSTVADWLLPLLIAIVVAASAVALAVKVRGLPVRPVLVAVRVLLFVPAVVPSFQEPTVAMPEALVVWELPVTEPPPEPAAKVTVVPATGLPNWSVTRTEGAVATLVSTVADWLLPLLIAIVVGGVGDHADRQSGGADAVRGVADAHVGRLCPVELQDAVRPGRDGGDAVDEVDRGQRAEGSRNASARRDGRVEGADRRRSAEGQPVRPAVPSCDVAELVTRCDRQIVRRACDHVARRCGGQREARGRIGGRGGGERARAAGQPRRGGGKRVVVRARRRTERPRANRRDTGGIRCLRAARHRAATCTGRERDGHT